MLGLFNSLKNEAIEGFRTLELKDGFDISIRVSSFKTQLNLANLILKLPEAIKVIEDNEIHKTHKLEEMQKAQEGGLI